MSTLQLVSVNQGVVRLLLLCCLIGGSGWLVWRAERPSADLAAGETTLTDNFFSNRTIIIEAAPTGQLAVGQVAVEDTIIRRRDCDELRLEVLNGRKTALFGGTNIHLRLESAAVLPEAASMSAYAIHGAELASTTPQRLSDYAAEWTLTTLDPEGAVSITVSYAPYSFDLGARAVLRSLPQLIPWSGWIAAGLLPLIATHLFIIWRRRSWRLDSRSVEPLNAPPTGLSAGAVGALISGRVGPAQLAATLVGMANRGDIQIVQTDAGYRVARRRATPELSVTESILLRELRLGLSTIARQETVEKAIGQQLFNRRIAEAYGGLLDELRARGLLAGEQRASGAGQRFAALLLVLIATSGAIATSALIPEGINLIGFWLGWLGAGWLVFARLTSVPQLTSVGQTERRRWLGFHRFMTDPRPLGGGQAEARAFLLYLPYAISFDVVEQWLARFNRDLITIPDWYFNTDNPAASQVFIQDILHISTQIARDFAKVATSES